MFRHTFPINQHPIERLVRVFVGLGMLSSACCKKRRPWAYLGIYPLATGASGHCPIYHRFGISTCAKASVRDSRS